MRILEEIDGYIGRLTALRDSFMSIGTQDDIDRLIAHGYIFKEVTQQVRLATATTQNATRERLFGNGTPARLPRIARPRVDPAVVVPVAPANPVVVPQSEEGETIWFETRKMTGGSRNILDLSKRSWVERGDPTDTTFDLGEPNFMRGAVEFFGLNPTETNETKDITLNFEGIDYIDNTILYPIGQKANGTWRLQIKGTSPAGHKITDAFKSKGEEHYLIRKIITFTKIESDYYFMSVFPESDLVDFRSASLILARNGSTKNAKQLGLLLKAT